MSMKEALIGQRFGRWKVISLHSVKRYEPMFNCICDCGTERVVNGCSLKSNGSKSCGCLDVELFVKRSTTHGKRNTKLYTVWWSMIARCKDKTNGDYGGRGISVCKEWLIAKVFLDWASGKWKEGLQIDRIDNDKGYFPENCRFVSPGINVTNQRKRKTNTSGYTGVEVLPAGVLRYRSRITYNKAVITLGCFKTLSQAVRERNRYIKNNGLPHKIQAAVLREA